MHQIVKYTSAPHCQNWAFDNQNAQKRSEGGLYINIQGCISFRKCVRIERKFLQILKLREHVLETLFARHRKYWGIKRLKLRAAVDDCSQAL